MNSISLIKSNSTLSTINNQLVTRYCPASSEKCFQDQYAVLRYSPLEQSMANLDTINQFELKVIL